MTTQVETLGQFAWWSSLKHGGLLIAPARLPHFFPDESQPLPRALPDRLRSAVQAQQGSDEMGVQPVLLDTVLEDVLQLPAVQWKKASAVGAEWGQRLLTGEKLKPRRLWLGDNGGQLPVFNDDVKQIGISAGRRSVARVVEWLRKSQQKIALLTNGLQWRLIHAGAEYEAWCEWDISLWFDEGEPGDQVQALLHLLSPKALTPPTQGKPSPLIAAIQETRKGQAELSSSLGERARLAVEHLIHNSAVVLEQMGRGDSSVSPRDVYIAATRIIMRCVVVLFAEARELLPLTDPVYNDSYSLQGLRDQLGRMAGGRSEDALRHQWSAWPRLLSLFRLIYEGSWHSSLLVRRYGGGLFEPGDLGSSDPVLRAMALFESPANEPTDYSLHYILDMVTRAWEKIPQGRSSRMVLSSIDFSDLSTEYIGILYEGLLDFRLRRADSPIVFLNLGDQPAVPFETLDAMAPAEVAKLFEKMKVKATREETEEEGEDPEEETEEGSDEADFEAGEFEGEVADQPGDSEGGDISADREQVRQRIHDWARRAAEGARLVVRPRGRLNADRQREYDEALEKSATGLVSRTVFAGEWYLVRQGNTRKGSGTFYTRPQLASPIARRALRELVYQEGVVRTPEDILSLKVCDPASGSGSFLLAALRFLTEALVESLHWHNCLVPRQDGVIIRLADGQAVTSLSEETIPKPISDPEFQEYLRAYLRRHIVERCLYGVDLDPLAVELGKLALWIETMDPKLPFEFLDHKMKVGDALVGCWFDTFQDYPAMAWEREGGDAKHERFVHHYREYVINRGANKGQSSRKGDIWTEAIKEKKKTVAAELVQQIRARRTRGFAFIEEQMSLGVAHTALVSAFEQIHNLPIHQIDERREIYQKYFGGDSTYHQLREAFDLWCAIWFWPGELLEFAPLPGDFLEPTARMKEIVAMLRNEARFFHWELEFPDVFRGNQPGFDAVIGNPPWEVQKPNSKEFFSDIDPLYRGYGKQEALDKQLEYFRHEAKVEAAWLRYSAILKAKSNWVKYVAHPFGDRVSIDRDQTEHHDFQLGRGFDGSAADHALWASARRSRTGKTALAHPFSYQGSADLNTYKMFLEVGHSLLRKGGRLALLVPSGVYSDQGSGTLRNLFLREARWSHLYAFQNERFVFAAVDHRFKVAAIQVEKGGKPQSLRTRFRLGPGDSPEVYELETDVPNEEGYLQVSVQEIEEFSPHSGAILEIRAERDLEIVKKLYAQGALLGDKSSGGWDIGYGTEFHSTSDSDLFEPRWEWEEKGYRPDEYGNWLLGSWRPYEGPKNILRRPYGLILSPDGTAAIPLDAVKDVALPLYQGVMIHKFDFAFKALVNSKGKTWTEVPWNAKQIVPKYLMSRSNYQDEGLTELRYRVGFRGVGRTTDKQTLISAILPLLPCADKVPFLTATGRIDQLVLCGILNSSINDWVQRQRQSGATLNFFLLEDQPLPDVALQIRNRWAQQIAELSLCGARFGSVWLELKSVAQSKVPRWAITPHERTRLRAINEAVVASLFGLDTLDLRQILSGCDHPLEKLANKSFTRTLDTKGFWRVEKELAPEQRFLVMAQVAFHDLKNVGLDQFMSQNDGNGWTLPETLCLADYGLGHDDRAKEHQPVGDRYAN
jgi:hypothetical protein